MLAFRSQAGPAQNDSPTQSGCSNNQIITLPNKMPCVDHPVPSPLFLTYFNLPVPLVIQESQGPLCPAARATACPLVHVTSIEISPVPPLGHPLNPTCSIHMVSLMEGTQVLIIVPGQQDGISPGSMGSSALLQNCFWPPPEATCLVWLVGLC